MKTLKVLLEERASLIEQQNTIVQTAQGEKREMNTDEETRFDDLQTQIEAFEPKIKRAKQVEERQKQQSANGYNVGGGSGDGEQKEHDKMVKRFSLHKALRSQLPGGVLDGVEAEFHQEAVKQARAFGGTVEGVAIPNETRAAAQTVTQDGGNYGGKTVFEEYQGIIDALKPKPIVQSLGATYVRGLKGPASFVKNKGGITATWEGEVDTVSPTKNEYDKKTMDPKRLSATVPISVQNLHQSVFDLEIFTAQEIGKAVERAIDSAFINGSGSGSIPLGVLNAAGVNVVVGGSNGAAPEWSHIVGMETAVGNANFSGSDFKYLFNTATKGKLKETLHTAGDAKYLISGGECNGYGYGVSNFLPSDITKGTGTNLSAAIFGDFKEGVIGEWGFSDMVVDHITGKKAGVIEITVNQYLDILLRNPEAFSVIKDWIV